MPAFVSAAPINVQPNSPAGYLFFPGLSGTNASTPATTSYSVLSGDCYTSAGQVTPPAGTKRVVFAVVGGGGGGGGSGSSSGSAPFHGGGGGAGGSVTSGSFTYTGGNLSLSIGAAGAGGTPAAYSNTSGAGGQSRLTYGSSVWTATGGSGGGNPAQGGGNFNYNLIPGAGGNGGNGGGGGGGAGHLWTSSANGGGGGGGGFNDLGQTGGDGANGGGPGGGGGSGGANGGVGAPGQSASDLGCANTLWCGGPAGTGGTSYLNFPTAVAPANGGSGFVIAPYTGGVGNYNASASLNLKITCGVPVGQGGNGGANGGSGLPGKTGAVVLQFEG
ncbi:hypothetical protein [Noviherbaspirillum galbum]|uniref:Uncharacterized protein n=1 Tax=Noviherbaspirillum galbum TaxID=2709383 RepID=A0A6B3SLP0_9BURK|nr:hypothetical protein [Noviherbaspirillum galbum]NEX61657.1 hypothetical protein [Noviherbaspirillum galbum]